MPINVGNAICSDTGERVLIKRKTKGKFVDGIWEQGLTITIKALASVQQPTKEEIELFTGLERDKDMKSFYVNKNIIASSEFDDTDADEIIYNGMTYRAMKLGNWNAYGYDLVMGVRIK